MTTYIQQNSKYWQQGIYDTSSNPETYVFRTYGRILKHDFNLDGSGRENLLDFGCGGGGNTKFYHDKGFDVYGVDLNPLDITKIKDKIKKVSHHFKVIAPQPNEADIFFDGVKFKIVTALQSLYYYNDNDLQVRLESLYNQMDPGGIMFATMMHKSCWYYDMSEPSEGGLRHVKLNRKTDEDRDGLLTSNHFINFVNDEDHLKNIFKMFTPVHIGFYDGCYRTDEGSEKHLTFFGLKP